MNRRDGMAEGAIFVGWGPPVMGREKESNAVFGESVQFWMQKQQQGEISSFETFALEPHGGDLWGFALIRGDQLKLAQLRYSPEVQRLTNRATVVVQNFGVITAVPPDQVQQFYQSYVEDVSDLL
jgi:hypothetical protein